MKSSLRFVVLGLAAFLATFALVKWRQREVIPTDGPPGMVWIPAGEFTMGTDSDFGWMDERPAHRVRVDGFWMDATEVTNAEFQRFVDATGYVTTAEKPPDVQEILRQSPPGTPPPPREKLVPGSLVFQMTKGPVKNYADYSQWWHWTPGASWKHPEGTGSTLEGREQHPVVQVSWYDAVEYCKWAGKRLPTEAEWERAARGGVDGKRYLWGDEPPGQDGRWRANIWQGEFPWKNTCEDGFIRTAPVQSFPANAYGLYEMSGNVWEWCSDYYDREWYRKRAGSEVIENPRGPQQSNNPQEPYMQQRSQRGGSFLCHESYCWRYRPSARHGNSPDTGMSHVGFRCVKSKE